MRKKKNSDIDFHLQEEKFCPLCKRKMTGASNKHHLIPKLKGGKEKDTVEIHIACHSKIHSLFTERELEATYNTIEKLLEVPEIQKFVKWIANKPEGFYDGSKQSKKKKFKIK